MRIIVFFDLPTKTSLNIREYNKFRKHLISNGFIMMQESVYVKLALNRGVSTSVVQRIKSNSPKEGVIQILEVTEKQFSKMEYVIGSKKTIVLDSDERLIIL